MQTQDHQSPLAIAYAQALLDLATEAKTDPAIADELHALRELLEKNPAFAQILSNPSISNDERGRLLHRIFDGRASKLILNFLGLVNEKGRLNILPSIAAAFDELFDRQQGKIEVDVTVAEKLGNEQIEAVRKKISDALKRTAVVHQYVDPRIIGGLVLRVQDQLIDGSVRAQLAAMRQQLLAARPA